MTRAVQAALAQISTRDVPMTLDQTSGPTLTVGGVGSSNAAFNPDEIARTVQVGGERRIEFNPRPPQGAAALVQNVGQVLAQELNLAAWTPEAAQLRFGGADLNGDGKIDLADLAILMQNYGSGSAAAGDLNQDRRVDDTDLRIFGAQYRVSPETSAPDAPDSTGSTGSSGGSAAGSATDTAPVPSASSSSATPGSSAAPGSSATSGATAPGTGTAAPTAPIAPPANPAPPRPSTP